MMTMSLTLRLALENNHDTDSDHETLYVWPNDLIGEKTGILDIPTYPDFTAIVVHEAEDFTLEVLGIVDYSVSLFEYEILLNQVGFHAEGECINDHVGYLYKENAEYYIILHNDLVHGGAALEIIFVKIADTGDETIWPESALNTFIPQTDIIVYEDYQSLSYYQDTLGYFDIRLYGALEESILSY